MPSCCLRAPLLVTRQPDLPAMATLSVLTFDHEGCPIQFNTWLNDLQLYLLSDSRDIVSFFDHTSGASLAPPDTADSATRSQWLTCDAAARLAIRNHLPLAERAHFGQHKTAKALDHFFALDPTDLTVNLLEKHLLAAENSIVAVGAARGTHRTPFFEGCSPSPLAPSYASAAAVDIHGTEEVRAASAPSGKHRNGKGKGGKSGGGGSGGGGGGGGGGDGGGGGGGGSGRGSGGVGGGGGGSGGSGGGGGGGSGSGGDGSGGGQGGAVQRGGSGGGQRQQQRLSETPMPQQLREWFAQRGASGGSVRCSYVIRTGEEAERPHWLELLRSGVDILALDYDAILAAIYALTVSAEGDCYLCVLPNKGIEAAALGASESSLPGTAPERVAICTCTRTGRHLDTLTRRPGSSLYTLTTEPPQVAASGQVSASGQVAAPCSCRLLSHHTRRWHHRLGHLSLPRLRGRHSHLPVSGLPRSLPSLPPSPAPPCLPCLEGRQRPAPHSSSFPATTAPLQTLHMDVKGEVVDVLIPWIRAVRLQLRERFREDLPILRLHFDRGGEFSSDLLRDFCHGEGILKSFTLPASPQQNGVAERRIGLVMELNLWAHVSLLETSPILRWTGKVGDATVFRVWGSRAFVRDTSADKLSSRAIPCVFLGFPPDAPGCPLPVDPLPPQGPVPSRVSQVDPVPLAEPAEVTVDFGAAGGGAARGAASRGAEPAGAEPGGAELASVEPWGAEPEGAEPGGAETEGAEPGGAESEGAESWGTEPRGTASVGGPAGAGGPADGGTEAGGAGATHPGGAGVTAGVGGPGGAGDAGPEGARTRGTGAAGAGGVGGAGAGDHGAGGAGAGGAGAGGAGAGGAGAGGVGAGGASDGGAGAGGVGVVGTGAGGAGAGDPGAGGAGAGGARAGRTGAGGTVQRRPFFVPPPPSSLPPLGSVLCQVLSLPSSTGLTPRLLCPLPHHSQLQLQLDSPLPTSPYAEQTDSLAERREPVSRPAAPVRAVRTGRRVPRPRPPPVLGTHIMALRPSSVPLQVPLPSPPVSSLADGPDSESDLVRAASPTVPRILAIVVTDPLFESAAASALVAKLVDLAAACRLDYAARLVAESVRPPSVGGECALGTDVLEDRQEDFECLATAVPHLVAMMLALEGDPDAPDIPTPRSYAEAIEGPYSSHWQAAMDAEIASWKSTGTYVDEVPPPGANIVSGMWIFRVKRLPGSSPVFKARYVARGFSQQQGVDFFQTFSHTPKMAPLRVLLHVAAQRDYELQSLDFSTTFLQGSLHEEIWLRRPLGFTVSFLAGT
ncbi:unnamed protein product [Closterium sp. NIES-54]